MSPVRGFCISFARLPEQANPWRSLIVLRAAALHLLPMLLLASTISPSISVVPINPNHFAGSGGACDVMVNTADESHILLAFKAAVDSDPWGTLSDWEVTKAGAPCSWHGVGCNSLCRVTSLQLKNRQLQGQVHPSLGDLQFLSYLNLADNKFYGRLPPQLGKCKHLERLNLARNWELGEGMLPPELGNCSSLRCLVLDEMSLKGSIPAWLGNLTMLEKLSLRRTWLAGTIPQALMEDLPRLLKLDVSGNQLEGSIPTNMSTRLQWLDLSENIMMGSIPDNLAGLFQLRHLDLSWNWLRGRVPEWLTNLTRLRHLSLIENELTGAIPPHIGRLVRLQRLLLPTTTGNIPPSLGTLTELRVLDFRGSPMWSDHDDKLLGPTTTPPVHVNQRGGIDFHLENLTRLTWLGLFDMSLSGHIPDAVTRLAELSVLDLRNNRLGGQIPRGLANLTLLSVCSLSQNSLRGNIPADIGSLTGVKTLLLFRNQLSGPIPDLRNLSALVHLDLDENALSGPIPAHLIALPQLGTLSLGRNQLSGYIPDVCGTLRDTNCSIRFLLLPGNNLRGPIPGNLYKCMPDLNTLDLHDNSLEGGIPVALARQLVQLDLSSNRLSGTISPQWGANSSLDEINLSKNQLTGEIPGSMFNSSRGLHTVLLQSNQLSGSLPSTQANCNYLWVLDLRDNRLSGSFPEQVSCFRNLRALLLSKNSFTGRVPFWIWHLSELHVLDLSHNRFQGSIPANLSGLRAYRDPYTASKPITEQEATCVSSVLAGKGFDVYHDNIHKATTLFDVSYNMLSGIIPVDLGHFRALNFLFLAHNQVAGPIPPTFSELNFVQVMDLSNNRLTGSIPVALAQLRSLRKFDVGNNLLSGVIPAGGQFATFNAWDYEPGNPELCGFPLPVSRSCPELDILDDEIASQPTDVVFWAAVSIGFAVGYLTVGSLIMAHRRLFDFVMHKGFYYPEPPSYQVSYGQYTSPQ